MPKRKFIEQSKILSIRVPISKYNELKEIIEGILEEFYRDNNLLAMPEEVK